MIANDSADDSYFNSKVTFYKDITISAKIINTELNNNTSLIATISGNINTISGNINTVSGKISNLASNSISGITVTGTAATGYTINIGNVLSKIYVNGDLYYNNNLLLQRNTEFNNAVGFEEYINQMI